MANVKKKYKQYTTKAIVKSQYKQAKNNYKQAKNKSKLNKIKSKNQAFAFKQATRNRHKFYYNRGLKLGAVFGLLIILCIASFILQQQSNPNATPLTFTALLKSLENVPSVSIPFINVGMIQLGDWGLFNFLRDFIKLLIQIPNVLIFLINGVMNLVSYVIYFMSLLFGV